MLNGFKKFISRGNVIDMAVGVVMGAAVTAVVNSIVANLINPLIAMIFGKPNLDRLLAFTFRNATISFGAILGAVINFLLIAVAVYFCILMPINKFRDISDALLQKGKDGAAEAAAEDKDEDGGAKAGGDGQTVALLTRIAEELEDMNRSGSAQSPSGPTGIGAGVKAGED